MKRLAIAALLLCALLSAPALSRIRTPLRVQDAPYSIDGVEFSPAGLSEADSALVADALKRQRGTDSKPAVDPRGFGSPAAPGMRAQDPRRDDSLAPPAGLQAEHVFRRGGRGTGTLMALGTTREPVASVTGRLSREGWRCVRALSGHGPLVIATALRGKETQVVVLDESQGRFLFVRREGR